MWSIVSQCALAYEGDTVGPMYGGQHRGIYRASVIRRCVLALHHPAAVSHLRTRLKEELDGMFEDDYPSKFVSIPDLASA